MKILLAGTPNFSVETFKKIIENFNVVGLISQPSRPVGRKLIITDPPTITLAKQFNIKTFQPTKIDEIYEELKQMDFDILITMAYGQIIPLKILQLSKIGSYNIHASLLPKYRGAAPIQYAIANGDKESGITFMEMVQKMDAGDILFQEKINIENDCYDSLLLKMSRISSNNIVNWIKAIKNSNFTKIKQDENLVSFSPKISKEDEKIQSGTMDDTINKIRSLSSIPGAYLFDTTLNKRIKIFKAIKSPVKNAIPIKCSDGFVYGIEYQIEGNKKVVLN
ncbi:MAG: methionyl-tRNA formyltransferase [Mycoplasma sp.]|nr:methionyl-tRNA formyltransferase [Mycoplasma sp.]